MLRSQLIEAATAAGDTLVVLVKEIDTDALFALHAVAAELDGPYCEHVRAFYEYYRDNDLALSVAQTNAKGDRTERPSEQADRDLYLPWSSDARTVRSCAAPRWILRAPRM